MVLGMLAPLLIFLLSFVFHYFLVSFLLRKFSSPKPKTTLPPKNKEYTGNLILFILENWETAAQLEESKVGKTVSKPKNTVTYWWDGNYISISLLENTYGKVSAFTYWAETRATADFPCIECLTLFNKVLQDLR